MKKTFSRLACFISAHFYPVFISIAALVSLPVAVWLAPWLYVAPVPVQLTMTTPSTTHAKIFWDDGATRSVDLVQHFELDNDKKLVATNLWLAELPPRPTYHLTIAFQPTPRVALRELKLMDSRKGVKGTPIFERNGDSESAWFTTDKVPPEYLRGAFVLAPVDDCVRLTIPEPISVVPPNFKFAIFKLWLFLSFIFISAILLAGPLFRKADTSPELAQVNSLCCAWPLWTAFLGGTIIHVILVLHSPVVLAGGDTGGYLIPAVALAEHRPYQLGSLEYECCRLPGYGILLFLMLKTVGYHFTRMAVAQGIFFCVSVLFFALSTRKWIHANVGAVAVFIAILSPAQVWASRSILSESTFGSFSLLAMSTFFMHVRTKGRKSAMWLIAFGFLATYATFIRPNGIALFAALVPLFVPAVIAIFRQSISMAAKVGAAMRYSLPYVVACATLLVAMTGWTAINYYRWGYFGASDMTGVTLQCGLMASGTFDSNCLLPDGLYDNYTRERYPNYYYSGFNLRHTRFVQLTNNGAAITRHTLSDLDRDLRTIAANSKRLTPVQGNLMGWLRSLWWGIAWPNVEAYTRNDIQLDYVTFDNHSATNRGSRSDHINKLRTVIIPSYGSDKLVYDEQFPNRWFSCFAWFADWYFHGWYVTLSAAALVGMIYTLRVGGIALTGPMYAFIINILLNVYLLNVFSRYINILDPFLVFQCAIAISLIVRAWQTKHAALRL